MEINSDQILAIIAFIALFSPIITSLIDNYFKQSRENIQNYELAKREALDDFIKSWLKCCNNHIDYNDKLEYYKNLNLLFVYFKNVPPTASSLFSVKSEHRFEVLNFIVTTLAKQIKKK